MAETIRVVPRAGIRDWEVAREILIQRQTTSPKFEDAIVADVHKDGNEIIVDLVDGADRTVAIALLKSLSTISRVVETNP